MKKKTFTPYQSIKWRDSLFVHHRKKGEWQEGVYLHPVVGTRFHHAIARSEHSDQIHTVNIKNIVPYEKIKSDDETLNFGKANVEELVKFLKRGIDGIFKDGLCKLTVDGPNVFLMNGYITIDPATTDVEHYLQKYFTETTCWSVTIWHHVPGNREQPDDVSDECVGSALTNGAAAQLALDTLYKVLANDFWESCWQDEMYAADMDMDRPE
jgi:hypothetical protein